MKQYLAKTIIESLMRDFPEETRAVARTRTHTHPRKLYIKFFKF